MATPIRPGSTIVLIRSADGEPMREQAQVSSADREHVTVALQPWRVWGQREPAVLVRTDGGATWAAPALCEQQTGDSATFQILRDWSPANRRKAPRFETRLSASIRNEPGKPLVRGRLLDISANGARLLLESAPAPAGVDLVISALDRHAEIPCSVVDTVVSGHCFETRLSFRYVFPEDQPVLASLLDLMATLQDQGRDLMVR